MLWIGLIILIVVIDQVSKFIVLSNMNLGDSITVIENVFYITYWQNKGAAWGIMQNGRYFFIAITLVALVVLFFVLFKSTGNILKLSMVLIIGGAIGNLIDRVIRGSVVDFLDCYIGSYDFPIFNIADSFVVVGTIVLAFYIMFIYKEPSKTKKIENVGDQE